MNNTFSFSRFCAYAKAETHLHLKKALSLVGLYILLAALYFMFPIVMNMKMQLLPMANLLTSVAVFGMFLITSGAFKVFQKTGGGTFAMQMPVATCEKFTLRAIAHMVIIPLLVMLLPRLTWSAVSCCSSIFDQDVNIYKNFWDSLTMLLIFQSTIFFGAILFRKNPLIKVLIAWAIFGIITVVTVQYMHKILGFNDADVKPIMDFLHTWNYELTAVFVVGFVVLSWIRFRKLQIIK